MLQKLEFTANNNEFIKKGAVTMTQEDDCTVVMTVPEHEMWQDIASRNEKPMCVFFAKEIEPGIYETRLNFHMGLKQYTDFQVISSHERLGKDGLPKKYNHESSMINYFDETVSPYGVADNIDQIKRYYKDQIESDASIVISVTEIRKDNQPQRDGWRWSKWGEYIGTRESQSEYIYDEPEIESVYVYHVYSVERKPELVLENTEPKKMKM